MSRPKASAWVKATDQLEGPPKPSLAWATAKRTQMKIFDDRIELAEWTLPFDQITDATLWETPPPMIARLLELRTAERTVQINFNPGKDITPHLPFPITRNPTPPWMTNARRVIYAVAAVTLIFALTLQFWG